MIFFLQIILNKQENTQKKKKEKDDKIGKMLEISW